MLYRKFSPGRQLTDFVECFYVWQTFAGDNTSFESPPSGFCSIVFNTGSKYWLQNKKYERLEVPAEFIAGQSIYSYTLHLDGPLNVCGIVLKPAALSTLYQLPVQEYTEERIPLQKVFKAEFVQHYITSIARAESPEAKATLLENFLLEEYNLKQPKPDGIDEAANKIVATNGMLHIGQLMESVFMSRRTFERNFYRKVGLSPKYYARIRRISYLANLIAGKKQVSWDDVISQAAYYDHSHFIKDFIEFTGRTPQQYLEHNNELANVISKPRQDNL